MQFRCCSVGGTQYRQKGIDLLKVGGDEAKADLDDVCSSSSLLDHYYII